MNDIFRSIPKMDIILNDSALRNLPYDDQVIKRFVRDKLAYIRQSIADGRLSSSPTAFMIAQDVAEYLNHIMEAGLKHVINATGIVVFTNFGRSPLAKEAIESVIHAARSYTDLEYNLIEGKRGSRQDHIRSLTKACFGSEDALVVNNNAAAVMLVLASFAKGKEVIISRGELVEIGGSFRMPDVMNISGAIMKEVGTTNKTTISDYKNAITDNTALIMKVHRSNFSITGFTDEVEISELSSLCREIGKPLFVDMGSGIPFDLSPSGILNEWTIPLCLQHGSDILCFSGDKVIGGPQSGIILSRTELIDMMARHPMHRAVRVDKLTIAALGSTLRLLVKGDINSIPVLRMITEPVVDVKKRAQKLSRLIKSRKARVISTKAAIGGGSAPTKSFDSYGVLIKGSDVETVYSKLRKCNPAVICRIDQDSLVFDLKTINVDEIGVLADLINGAISNEA